MDDLYARIVAEIDRFDAILVHPVRFNTALRAVLEVHKPSGCSRTDGYCCTECGHTSEGCSTIKAAAKALRLTEEGDTDGG